MSRKFTIRPPELGKVLRWRSFMTYFVGIDIAKHKHFASIVSSSGESIEEPFDFYNNRSGFDKLLSKLKRFDSNDIIIGYESTAHYHLNLDAFLRSNGYTCVLINPILTKKYRQSSIRDVKNDRADSLAISMFLSSNYSSKRIDLRSNNLNELYVMCNELHSLKQERTKLYIQLTACLDVTFPELKEFFKGNLKTTAAHNFLKKFQSADDIKKRRIDYIYSVISKNSKGYTKQRAESLKALANNSVGISSLAYSIKIKNCINQIELIDRQIDDLLAVIISDEIVRDSALLKIPGMGYLQAANILSVINNISRFDNSSQIVAYAGLDPKVRESGTFKPKSTRMSKRGNSLLRYSLIWSANNCVRNSKTMKEYYLKKRSEGKSHYNALGHCAKKLINYIFWILNHPNEEFILE